MDKENLVILCMKYSLLSMVALFFVLFMLGIFAMSDYLLAFLGGLFVIMSLVSFISGIFGLFSKKRLLGVICIIFSLVVWFAIYISVAAHFAVVSSIP